MALSIVLLMILGIVNIRAKGFGFGVPDRVHKLGASSSTFHSSWMLSEIPLPHVLAGLSGLHRNDRL